MIETSFRASTRLLEILRILAGHGLLTVGLVTGLKRVAPFLGGILDRRPHDDRTLPVRLREALEDLGVTFVKIGQILCTRPDIVPPDFIAELSKLLDSARPMPADEARRQMEANFDRPLDQIFRWVSPEPLAAASIGQVHEAELLTGESVVIKVRRTGVAAQVERDLFVLDQLADLATRYWEAAADYDIRGLVDEFKQSLRDELNYLKEMQNARRFRENFAQHPIIRVPRVYADLTNQEVLVMDKVSGIKVNDIEALDAAGINRAQLAENATIAVLQMVYEDGFFHADPHPGNLFVQPDGKITLIDFGMVGRLNRPTLNNMLGFLLAVGTRNPEALADAALDLTVSQLPVDRNALVRDAEKLLYDFYGLALDKLSAQALLERVNMIFLKHKLVLPSNLALMLRMLTLVEGVGRLIYPQFNYFKTMTSYTRRRFTNRLSLEGLNEEAPRLLVDTAGLTYDLPFRLENIYRTVAAEGVVIEPMERDTEYFLVWLERQVNRLGLAILTGAFIVCTARLVPYFLTTAPGWVALLTLACFFGSVVAGALFASDSIRKLRMK